MKAHIKTISPADLSAAAAAASSSSEHPPISVSGTQIILASATLPTSLDAKIGNIIPLDTFTRVTTEYLHHIPPHIKQKFVRLLPSEKPGFVLKFAKKNKMSSVMLFCKDNSSSYWLYKFLEENGVSAALFNGNVFAEERKDIYQKFMNQDFSILVSTDIASRGLDTTHVQTVMNYDFPHFVSDYIHRVGRVGRLGSNATSEVISLVAHKYEVEIVWLLEMAARKMTQIHNVNANIKRKLFFFWVHLAGFSYTTLRDVKPKEQEANENSTKPPWWKRINLGENKYRNGIALLCISVGYLVLFISIIYPRRAVKQLWLLKGGRAVKIDTFGYKSHYVAPLDSISFDNPLHWMACSKDYSGQSSSSQRSIQRDGNGQEHVEIKPKIVPGISKRDSNRNGTNKPSNEIPGEHSTLQESSSGPSDTDKQSNTKPIQQQSAFSLRPKTGLRGSVAPRLHGSMDSMKHIPTAAPGNVPSDPNSEAAVSVATDQCSNSDTTPSTVVAADQSINATPGNQVAELSTPVVAPVKDSEKQPDETIKGTLTANILEAENAENSSQVSASVKEVEKGPLTTENTPKPAAKPVISRRSRFSVQPKIRTKVPNLSGVSSSPSKPAIPSVLESQHVSSEVQKASPATKNDEPKLQSKSVSENNDTTELVGEGIAQETRIDLSKPNTDAVEKIEKSVSNDKTLSSSDKPAVGATADGKSLTNSGKTANDVVSDNKTLSVSGKTLTTASPEDKDLGSSSSSSKTADDVTTDGTNLPAGGNTVTVATSDDKTIPSSGKTVADTTSDSKAPLSNDKPTTDAASGVTTLPSSGKPVTDETSNDKTLSNSNKPTTVTPQKVISRRSRFALQPKIGARPGNRPFCTSSPQVKPTVRFQDLERKQQLPEHLQKLSEEKTIGLSTVVVFQDGKECEVIDPTPLSAEPEASPSPKSATSEICSSSQVESLSPSVESGDVTDSASLSEKNKPIPQIKSSDEIVAAAATNVSKSQELETKSPVSRRSKFQVRPKLGITKRPENTTEECANQETQKSTKILKPTISKLPLTKAVKNLGTANSFTKLVNSEPDGSSTDHTPPKVPRIMKDDSHVDNTKQKDYLVTLPKTVTKSRKTLPLREKQKKPDLSEHPADKPPDRSKMKMRDLIYWNPISSPMKSPEKKTTRTIRIGEEVPPKVPETQSNENEPFAVPQVKIGADGNIVINEESLVISNTQPSAPICSETVDETDIYSNYGSFRKYTPKSKWSLKEIFPGSKYSWN
ncbi:Hypothetical predicted protein [Octopus vulgaris]|nr:Hypothetical predicted protein [Octopus vulgaris]